MKLVTFDRLKPDYGIPYSRDHLRRKVKAGEFPAIVRLSGARIAWFQSDVEAWLSAKAERRAAGAEVA